MRVSTIFFFFILTLCPLQSIFHKLKQDISLQITSPAFENNTPIPPKYTLDGENIRPELDISNIPLSASSLAVIIEDPDAPNKVWVHWIAINIPVSNILEENAVVGTEIVNSFGYKQYGGPKPPKGSGFHHYYFRIFAIKGNLICDSIDACRKEIKDNKVGEGFLMGIYMR